MAPKVFERFIRCSIRLHLRAKHDSELVLAVIPELYQPIKGDTIDIFDVISKDKCDLPLLDRLSNIRV